MGTLISQEIPYSGVTLSQQSTPIGAIIPYMGTTAPSGYLACDGGVYNISLYPLLAGFFEAQFGSINYFGGDGTTTFAVPNLQGEFLRGAGTNGHTGEGNGSAVGAHQNATRHKTITMSPATNKTIIMKGYSNDWAYTPVDADIQQNSSTGYVMNLVGASATKTSESNSPQYATSRPTNTSVLYIIKAKSDRLDKITFAEVDDTSTADDVVWSAEKISGEISRITEYSTTEKVVGKWIDGKPIYQKTFSFSGVVSQNWNHGIVNLDNIVDIKGVARTTTGTVDFIPEATNSFYIRIQITASSIYISTNITGTEWQNGNGFITIQYTKTS